MISHQPVQAALRRVHAMDRSQCIHALTHFADIPLDFDEAFLEGASTERLRHLLAAAVETAHRRRARQAVAAMTEPARLTPRSICRA